MSGVKIEFIQECKYLADCSMISDFAKQLGGHLSTSRLNADNLGLWHLTAAIIHVHKATEQDMRAVAKDRGYYVCRVDHDLFRVTNSREFAKREGFPGVYFVPREVMAGSNGPA